VTLISRPTLARGRARLAHGRSSSKNAGSRGLAADVGPALDGRRVLAFESRPSRRADGCGVREQPCLFHDAEVSTTVAIAIGLPPKVVTVIAGAEQRGRLRPQTNARPASPEPRPLASGITSADAAPTGVQPLAGAAPCRTAPRQHQQVQPFASAANGAPPSRLLARSSLSRRLLPGSHARNRDHVRVRCVHVLDRRDSVQRQGATKPATSGRSRLDLGVAVPTAWRSSAVERGLVDTISG